MTATDKRRAKAGHNVKPRAVPVPVRAPVRPAGTVWRRRHRVVAAWGMALVGVVGVSAWLALREGLPTATAPARAKGVSFPVPVPLPLPLQMQMQMPLTVSQMSVEQLLAAGKATDWRVVRLSDNTAVLAIEFPNLLAQGQSFNRTAALIEKKSGARGHVLIDAELAALVASSGDNIETFYQGHDYTGVDLARFYSLATSQQVSLNAQEVRLRTVLIQAGVIREQGPGQYAAIGKQAVISFSAVQPDNPATPQDELIDPQRRTSVLLHEFSHGQFFTRPDYQKACWKFWTRALDDGERQSFRTYLAKQDYDAGNEELMVNETQALLMHTPDRRAFNAAAMGVDDALLERWRQRFQKIGASAAAGIDIGIAAGTRLPR